MPVRFRSGHTQTWRRRTRRNTIALGALIVRRHLGGCCDGRERSCVRALRNRRQGDREAGGGGAAGWGVATTGRLDVAGGRVRRGRRGRRRRADPGQGRLARAHVGHATRRLRFGEKCPSFCSRSNTRETDSHSPWRSRAPSIVSIGHDPAERAPNTPWSRFHKVPSGLETALRSGPRRCLKRLVGFRTHGRSSQSERGMYLG